MSERERNAVWEQDGGRGRVTRQRRLFFVDLSLSAGACLSAGPSVCPVQFFFLSLSHLAHTDTRQLFLVLTSGYD